MTITVHQIALCGVPEWLLYGIAYPASLGSNVSFTLHNVSSKAWFLCTPVVYGTLQHCAEQTFTICWYFYLNDGV